MAHELGHWAHTDVLRMLFAGQVTLAVTLSCLGLALFEPSVYRAFGFARVGTTLPYIVGIQIVSAIFAPLNVVTAFAVHALSRNREFAADRFAVELG